MFVTAHAQNRAMSRLGADMGARFVDLCEGMQGEGGTVAYIVGEVPASMVKPEPKADPQWYSKSNGGLVIAVAVDGSIETVYFRRASQDNTAGFFGARALVDMRVNPLRLT